MSLARARVWIEPHWNPAPYRYKLGSGSARDLIDVQRVAWEHDIPLPEFTPPSPHPGQQLVFQTGILRGQVYIN